MGNPMDEHVPDHERSIRARAAESSYCATNSEQPRTWDISHAAADDFDAAVEASLKEAEARSVFSNAQVGDAIPESRRAERRFA